MLPEGSHAPEFNLTNHHGDPVKLSDLQGQRVLVWFYPKADTPG